MNLTAPHIPFSVNIDRLDTSTKSGGSQQVSRQATSVSLYLC